MFKIKSFKLPKNTRYNYTPRYYNGKSEGNIYSFDSKFAKYRETTNQIDFGAQWAEARSQSRNRKNRSINKRVILIALILAFIFFWMLDFDLTLFTKQR